MPITGPMGWTPNPEGVAKVLGELREPLFAGAAPLLMASAPREHATELPFAVARMFPKWKRKAQGIGDCVSWGYELSAFALLCLQVLLTGETWLTAEVATEPIYAGSRVEALGVKRGGYSDGSYGAAAAKWLNQWGVLLRGKYDEGRVDLTKYSADRAKEWGNFGVPDELEPVAKLHPVKQYSLVRSFDQAAKAIEAGYPVPVCSGQGFASKRDSEGFCKASGSWAHCMAFVASRRGKRPGLLCANSWGKSVSGPTGSIAIPSAWWDCSWWVDADVCDRMLRQEDSFALSDAVGFPPKALDWADKFPWIVSA